MNPFTLHTPKASENGKRLRPFGLHREQSESSLGSRLTQSVRGSSLNGKKIKMRISDIHFREVEA